MRFIAAIIAGLSTLGAAAGDEATLQPFAATYEVHHSGARVGETTLTLSRSPDSTHWEFTSRTQPRGLAALIRRRDVVETSAFVEIADGLLPRSYYFDDGSSKGKRNSRVDFDWQTSSAVSTYKGESTTQGVDEGTLDRLLVQLAIMRDLRRDALPISYSIVDRNEVKAYDVAIIGEEMLPTPAGQFDTVKLRRQRPGSSRATLIWAAPELSYLPVKMVQLKDDRPNAVLTLTEVHSAP